MNRGREEEEKYVLEGCWGGRGGWGECRKGESFENCV